MKNEVSVQYYSLMHICEPQELEFAIKNIFNCLDSKHRTTIKNALIENARLALNGIVYIRIKGLANILRTGNSGVERVLVYEGIEGLLAPAHVVSIEGEEYIASPAFFSLIEARLKTTYGKTNLYVEYSKYLFDQINNLPRVVKLNNVWKDSISKGRKGLKKKRISKYGIRRCEFSNVEFTHLSEVEFAHIDGVATHPFDAGDVDNGVIILKEIHADLTTKQILTYQKMVDYCKENEYSLEWINFVVSQE